MDDAVERLLRAAAEIEPRSGIRACVIGGIARSVWASPRATADVDVIVDTGDPARVIALAPELGLLAVARENEALAQAGMARLRLPEEPTGPTRLDVIASTHEYYGRVFQRSVELDAFGTRLRVAAAEDIVVLKVLADRPQDRLDAAAVIEAQGDRLRRDIILEECEVLELEPPESLR